MNDAGTLEAQDAADPARTRAAEIAQLFVRAREGLRDEGVRFDVPEGLERPAHLDAVLEALYALFFEEYRPAGDAVPRAELCDSSLQLVRTLTYTPVTAVPAAFALRSLLCFHASRMPARISEDGSFLPISEQDPSRWDRLLLAEAFWCRELAGMGAGRSRFHLEAAIAASHALGSISVTTETAPAQQALFQRTRASLGAGHVSRPRLIKRSWAMFREAIKEI